MCQLNELKLKYSKSDPAALGQGLKKPHIRKASSATRQNGTRIIILPGIASDSSIPSKASSPNFWWKLFMNCANKKYNIYARDSKMFCQGHVTQNEYLNVLLIKYARFDRNIIKHSSY